MRRYNIKVRITLSIRDWWIGFKVYGRLWDGPILTFGFLFFYVGIFFDHKPVVFEFDKDVEQMNKRERRRYERLLKRGFTINISPYERCIICGDMFKRGSTKREHICAKHECQDKPFDYIKITPKTKLDIGDIIHVYNGRNWEDILITKKILSDKRVAIGPDTYVNICGNEVHKGIYLLKPKPQHWFYEHNPEKIPKFKKGVEFPKFD